MDPTEYEKLTAIVTHATITKSVASSFPHLTLEEIDAMFIGVVDRLARMRGWSIRPERRLRDDDDD
jgi:hypothetical protein